MEQKYSLKQIKALDELLTDLYSQDDNPMSLYEFVEELNKIGFTLTEIPIKKEEPTT